MCHHKWDIESQGQATSKGVCIYCNEKKEFLNAFPDLDCYNEQFYWLRGKGKITRTPLNNVDSYLEASKKNRLQKGLCISMALRDNLYQNELNEL